MQTSYYTPIYITLLVLALVAILAVIIYAYTRKPPLSKAQERPLLVFILICVGLALFAGGMWIGDKITPFVVVEPKSAAREPFWQLQYFGFETDQEGWEVDANCAPATGAIEKNAKEAYDGEGYLRLNTDLAGQEAGKAITLKQMVCLKYEPKGSWQLELTDGIIGYIKVQPSLDTVGNTFQAEYQVRGTSGQDAHWSKARYPLKPGEWIPIVWVKPSWMTVGTTELFFPATVDGIWITIWADRGFKGDILVDGIGLYMLQRR
jgi:hypothetical protein